MCPLQALSLLSPIRYACFLYSIQNESLISGTLFSAVTLQPITDLRAKLLNQTTMLWNAKAMTGADMRKHSPVSSKRTLFGGVFSSDQQVSEINYFWYFVSVTLTCGFQWGVLPRGCHWTSCRDQMCDPGFVYLNIGSFLITAFLFLIILFENLPYPSVFVTDTITRGCQT